MEHKYSVTEYLFIGWLVGMIMGFYVTGYLFEENEKADAALKNAPAGVYIGL